MRFGFGWVGRQREGIHPSQANLPQLLQDLDVQQMCILERTNLTIPIYNDRCKLGASSMMILYPCNMQIT